MSQNVTSQVNVPAGATSAPMSQSAIVQLQQTTRSYGSGEAMVKAVDGVDLVIPKGAFLALTGPSGSGKSTCLNLIGAIDAPSSGKVIVDGVDLSTLNARQMTEFRKERIGFIFQEFNLIPVLTVHENVQLPLQIKGGLSRTQIAELVDPVLERVGLKHLAHRLPRQLSGGQQQRVAIARALVKKPAVLLADEPTANLDSHTAREILGLMKELNASFGTTFIFSSHDPLVMEYATRLVRLRDGKVIGIEERG
ncbi:ABC transporter ATP-binding protein [Hyalangium minutum]|uniref:ABC transporter, ATP-binding protein n=1 Tax=Hyalangium minutum TaxID=394096 RepID=A0A085WVY2_9BACT|nr:ABC transporter ATP-binding protein [Hyalangium minutum]KFE71845.1 ABC transporter, ATP-binding protein [Hyalangium minutum]